MEQCLTLIGFTAHCQLLRHLQAPSNPPGVIWMGFNYTYTFPPLSLTYTPLSFYISSNGSRSALCNEEMGNYCLAVERDGAKGAPGESFVQQQLT